MVPTLSSCRGSSTGSEFSQRRRRHRREQQQSCNCLRTVPPNWHDVRVTLLPCRVGDRIRRTDVVELHSATTGMCMRSIFPREYATAAAAQPPLEWAEVAASGESGGWEMKPFAAHDASKSTLRCGEFFRLYHWEREAYLVAEDAWTPDGKAATALADAAPPSAPEDDPRITTVFLQPAPAEEAGPPAIGLWELEHADPTCGEDATWSKPYRIRHLFSGKYLAMAAARDRAATDEGASSGAESSVLHRASSGGGGASLGAPTMAAAGAASLTTPAFPYHVYLSTSSDDRTTQFVLLPTEPTTHGPVLRGATASVQHCGTAAFLIGPRTAVAERPGIGPRRRASVDSEDANEAAAIEAVTDDDGGSDDDDSCTGAPRRVAAQLDEAAATDSSVRRRAFDAETCALLTGSPTRCNDDALHLVPATSDDTADALKVLYATSALRDYIWQFSPAAHLPELRLSPPEPAVTAVAAPRLAALVPISRPVRPTAAATFAPIPGSPLALHQTVTVANSDSPSTAARKRYRARQLWQRGVSGESAYNCAEATQVVRALIEFVCNTKLPADSRAPGVGVEPVSSRQRLFRELDLMGVVIECLQAPFSTWSGPIDVAGIIGWDVLNLCELLYTLVEFTFKVGCLLMNWYLYLKFWCSVGSATLCQRIWNVASITRRCVARRDCERAKNTWRFSCQPL